MRLHSQKINEQLVFAKMNLPDHTVLLVPGICLNFKAYAIVMLLDHFSFTIHDSSDPPVKLPVSIAHINVFKQ